MINIEARLIQKLIFNVHSHRRKQELKRNGGFLLPMLICILLMKNVGQAQSPAQYIKAGDRAVADQKWDEAYSYFEQGYLLDTSSFDLSQRYADAARQIHRSLLAEKLYQKNYDKDNGTINPDGLFWLAMMQKQNGKYEDAQRNFKKYVKKHKSTGSRDLIKRAAHETKSAVWAMDHFNQQKLDDKSARVIPAIGCKSYLKTISRLPENINSGESEIAPRLVEGKLFFSGYEADKWKMKEADWHVKASALNADSLTILSSDIDQVTKIELDNQTSNANFSKQNDKVYFSRSNGASTQMMVATFDGNVLSDAKPLEIINTEGTINSMPFPANVNGVEYLFFISDREGGEGGLDIWYSINKGGWSKPKNAGSKINTEGDEVTPFFSEGNLYFSSDWHEGFGGFDIFKAAYTGTSFERVENVGSVFNSSYNDLGYSISEENDNTIWHFFSSNRPVVADSDLACCNDIYVVEEQKVCADDDSEHEFTGTLDSLMRELPVVLYFHNDEPNPDSWDTTTILTYRGAYDSYKKLLPRYIKENTKGLKGEKLNDATDITNDFFELKVDKGLNDLNLFSDLLLKELQKGRSLDISVRGFASPRAQTDYNLSLTKRRTASLVNFLRVDSAGVFAPYIDDLAANGARLTFTLLPFGEFKADKSVSDDLVDEKNSIYNRAACLERKIEIESVREILPTQKKAELKLELDTFSFGSIGKYDEVNRRIQIENRGNAILQIDSVIAECGCTEPHLDKYTIPPGDHATLDIGFRPFGSKDHVVKHVYIYIAGEEPRVITFDADIKK